MGGEGYAQTRADAADSVTLLSQPGFGTPRARCAMPGRWPRGNERVSRGRLTDSMDGTFASSYEKSLALLPGRVAAVLLLCGFVGKARPVQAKIDRNVSRQSSRRAICRQSPERTSSCSPAPRGQVSESTGLAEDDAVDAVSDVGGGGGRGARKACRIRWGWMIRKRKKGRGRAVEDDGISRQEPAER